MIKLKEAVIVEGKYDKIKLKSLIDAPIIETNGFRIFNDKEKQNLIRQIAKQRGILIMTDSDSGGFVIRNFLKGAVPKEQTKHCYIPEILGKEKRKSVHSKEGMLGVEGISDSILLDAIKKSGAVIIDDCSGNNNLYEYEEITKADLFDLGLTGRENSAKLRTSLLNQLNLPTYLTTNAMLSALNCLISKQKLIDIICQQRYNNDID